MKRILLLTTLAAMLAAAMALSGVAQAKPTSDSSDAKCEKLAIQTLGPSFNAANYTFHGGTAGPDDFSFTGTAEQPDVFCGFGSGAEGGDFDGIFTLEAGDIFLGGAGDDSVNLNQGTFYGGEGNDSVTTNSGTFNGEAGDDTVTTNDVGGTFNGGAGDDSVTTNNGTVDLGDEPL